MNTIVVGIAFGVGLDMIISIFCVDRGEMSMHTPLWYRRWSDYLKLSGFALTPLWHVSITVAVCMMVLVSALLWSGSISLALVIAIISSPLPSVIISSKVRSARTKVQKLWPHLVDSLLSGVRSGVALPELLSDFSDSGPKELRPYFLSFASRYASDGRFVPALNALKNDLADPVADRIIEALRVAREVGGSDLVEILRNLSVLLREDLRVRGELEARQSWTTNAARVGVAAPWLVLLLLANRTQAAQAYSTAQGITVLSIGGVVSLFAYVLMRRIGRLRTEQRYLR